MPGTFKWAISFIVGAALIVLGWKVRLVLVTLHILICFLLVVVVLLQSGKAADLAGAFGGAGSQTAFGPRGAATFLSKATTWCAVMFMLTSMALVLREDFAAPGSGNSIFRNYSSKPAPQPQSTPPAPVPQQPQPSAPPTQAPPQSQPPAQQPPTKQPPAKP